MELLRLCPKVLIHLYTYRFYSINNMLVELHGVAVDIAADVGIPGGFNRRLVVDANRMANVIEQVERTIY